MCEGVCLSVVARQSLTASYIVGFTAKRGVQPINYTLHCVIFTTCMQELCREFALISLATSLYNNYYFPVFLTNRPFRFIQRYAHKVT